MACLIGIGTVGKPLAFMASDYGAKKMEQSAGVLAMAGKSAVTQTAGSVGVCIARAWRNPLVALALLPDAIRVLLDDCECRKQ